MTFTIRRVPTAALFLLLVFVPLIAQAAAGLEAGMSAVDITPKLEAKQPIWLAGKEYNRAAQGVHDPLFARALVLRDGSRKFALVSVDSIGLPNPSVVKARKSLKDFAYVLVASTHSHESPDVIGVWGPSPGETGVVASYVAQIEAGIVEAVRQADAAAVPVRVEYGTAEDQSLLGDYRRPEVYDSVLRVLKFVRASDGKTNGLLVQWNSHGVEPKGGAHVSRDFMGVVVDALEKRHGCRAVYFQGAIGGLMGTPDKTFNNAKGERISDGFELIRMAGEAVANLADKAIKQAQAITLTPLEVYARPILIPLGNEGFLQATAAGVLNRPLFAWPGTREGNVEQIVAGKSEQPPAMQTEVAYLRLGELHVAAIPGELYPELVYGQFQEPADPGADFVDAALETPIAKILPSKKMLVLGLANDEVGYIVPKRQWDVKPPFAYGLKSAQYGEKNSVGPETARMLMEALADRVREAPAQ